MDKNQITSEYLAIRVCAHGILLILKRPHIRAQPMQFQNATESLKISFYGKQSKIFISTESA